METEAEYKTKVVDCAPKYFLLHKLFLEKAVKAHDMIERQAKRVNENIEGRKSIWYNFYKDERKIEISVMALNRLINHYNTLIRILSNDFNSLRSIENQHKEF